MVIQRLIVKSGRRMRGPSPAPEFRRFGPPRQEPFRLRYGRRVGAGSPFDYNPAMPLDYLISALVTLLVVVDPVGLTPAFLAVTQGLPAAARQRIAFRACLIAAAVLAGTALIGDWLF